MRILISPARSGEPPVTLAQATGASGNVVATDIAAEMLFGARAHAADRGRGNTVFAAGSGAALPLPDETFDRQTCRFGVMFFPDIESRCWKRARCLGSAAAPAGIVGRDAAFLRRPPDQLLARRS